MSTKTFRKEATIEICLFSRHQSQCSSYYYQGLYLKKQEKQFDKIRGLFSTQSLSKNVSNTLITNIFYSETSSSFET